MKLNIWKNILIGLKGLTASVVGGLVTFGLRTLMIWAGISVWIAWLLGIPFGLFMFGVLAKRWWGWK